MKSIESRLQRAEKAVTPINKQVVFAAVERRGDEMGIILPDGDWLSLQEAKVSPKCKNVIAWDKEHGPVLWRSKITWLDLVVLTQLKS